MAIVQKRARKLDDATIERIITEYLHLKAEGRSIKPLLDRENISRQNIFYWLPDFADRIKEKQKHSPAKTSQASKFETKSQWPQEAVDAVIELKSVIRYLEKKIRELESPSQGFHNLTTNPG